MTIDEIREFIAAAQRHGMNEAFVQRGSRSLRLGGLNCERPTEAAEPLPAMTGPGNPVIRAGQIGVLRLRHPSGAGDPLGPGRAFKKGECLAFLEVGPCLKPVLAPESGRVEEMGAADGDVIGYGAPLLRYVQAAG